MSNNIVASYLNSDSTQRKFSFQTVSRNHNSNEDTLSMLDWMAAQEIVSLEQVHGDLDWAKDKIEFSLVGQASDYYSLFKGLIAFGKPRGLEFKTVAGSRSFLLQVEAAQEREAKMYLSKIFNLISSEIRFKQVLRKVIVNQEKFEREEKLLFSSL